ncbi:MAG: polysaccharide biosynthesis C-terminal domain-containing protein [Chloroflexi bacterium]|nr:polysaccharide biosynthesis C-terminal domain-containing protein [Chloroflexota bacterium]
MRDDAHERPIFGAFMASAAGTVAATFAAGLAGVIATRALGPTERGLLAAAVVWAGVIGSLVSAGVPQAVTYFVARSHEPNQRATYATTGLGLAAVGGALLSTLGVLVVWAFVAEDVARPLAILFAAALPVVASGAAGGALLGIGAYAPWNVVRLAHPVVNLAATVAVVTTDRATATTIAAVYAGAAVVQLALALLGLRRHGLYRRPTRAAAGGLMSYGWRQLLAGLAWLVSYKLDQLVLSFVVAPSALGLYAVAASVGDIIVPVSASAGYVVLARVAAARGRNVGATLLPALAFCLAVAGTLAGGAIIAADDVIALLFGADFAEAVTPMRILLVGAVALAVSTVVGDTLRGLGRPLDPARAEVLGVITTIALLAALVPSRGIEGAAIASTISYTVVMTALVVTYRRRVRRPAARA